MAAKAERTNAGCVGNGTARRGGRNESPWARIFREVIRNKGGTVGLAIVALCAICAVAAPVIAPYDPIEISPADRLSPPSGEYPLGTDLYGRDILSRLLFGARLSLRVGFLAVAIGSSAGSALGLLGGYYGGVIEEAIMRLVDVMLAFPGILLALVIVAFLGPGLTNVIIAVGIGQIPSFARLSRGCVLAEKEKEYVLAAQSIGCRPFRVVGRHILPNVISSTVVLATLAVAWAILNASALSFLGLGAKPPTPEWGTMLSEGRDYLRVAPWIMAFPGLAIMLLVVGVNLFGDALRVAVDPHLKV